MNWKSIKVENYGTMAIVRINRPKALNSINTLLLLELESVIDHLEKDDQVKVIILTGEGKAFAAGADISEMRNKTALEGRWFGEFGTGVLKKWEVMSKPTIAAVNGFALGGGCELAMACDIRIASTKAEFGQPEVGLGIIPGFAGTQRLPRLVGMAKAKELIFTGDLISAEEACRIGLVNRVVESDQLMDACIKMAEKIALKGPNAIMYSKKAINDGMETDLERGTAIENSLFGLCFASEEQSEGMTAFLEKRKPNF